MTKMEKSGNGKKAIIIALALGMMALGTIGIWADEIDLSFSPGSDNGTTVGINPPTRSNGTTTTTTTVLFEDDFEDGNFNDWAAEHATIQNGSFTTGNYIVQLHAENNVNSTLVYDAVDDWVNFTSEATFQLGDSFNSWAEVWIVFYDSNTILFDVKNDVISLNYHNASGKHTIASTPYDIKASDVYNIKIVTVLQNVEVFVNDVKVISDEITGWAMNKDGIFGFNAYTADPGWFKLNIDNVKITENTVNTTYPVNGTTELFYEDFEDGNYNGWDTTPTAYMQNSSMGGGAFALQLQQYGNNNGTAAVTSGLSWSNYEVEASIVLQNSKADVMFYLQQSDFISPSGYGVVLDPVNDKVGLMKYIPSMSSPYLNLTDHNLVIGTEYKVSVKVYDNQFQVFVDDILLIVTEDTLYTHGTVGVLTQPLFDNSTNSCLFDNVKVTQLEALGPSSTLSIISDEDTYQPGDDITLTATYDGANTTNCHFMVEYPDGTELASQTRIVLATGNVTFSFNLPIDAPDGVYTAYATTYDAAAQVSFNVASGNFGIVSMSVPDITLGSPLRVNTTIENQQNHGQDFVLVVQIIDSNGVPLIPLIRDNLLLLSGQTYTETNVFLAFEGEMPTGTYHVQVQLLTALPSEGGYALDFMDATVTVSEA